jgi:hypothetical protein
MAKGKKKGKTSDKAPADRRTMNPPQPDGGRQDTPADDDKGFQEQDAERRQGSFEGAGEHARTGNPGHE